MHKVLPISTGQDRKPSASVSLKNYLKRAPQVGQSLPLKSCSEDESQCKCVLICISQVQHQYIILWGWKLPFLATANRAMGPLSNCHQSMKGSGPHAGLCYPFFEEGMTYKFPRWNKSQISPRNSIRFPRYSFLILNKTLEIPNFQ